MNTVVHHITHKSLEAEAQNDNNLFRVLGKKIVLMFNKESHTLGEYILLYALIFFGLIFFLFLMELLVL